MKAMILAAGRGERMRPLTDTCPKPLLKVAGKPLLVYHIEKLAALGVIDIVINHAWLGEQIEQVIGDGSQWGVNICYSAEPAGGLETLGGIVNALSLLGNTAFLVINGDIWTDFDFAQLPQQLNDSLAHLVLVDNPAHNPAGDFALTTANATQQTAHKAQRLLNLSDATQQGYTFSGIALYHPDFFAGFNTEKRPLAPLLKAQANEQNITAQHYAGRWTDVGTVARLTQLEQALPQG